MPSELRTESCTKESMKIGSGFAPGDGCDNIVLALCRVTAYLVFVRRNGDESFWLGPVVWVGSDDRRTSNVDVDVWGICSIIDIETYAEVGGA
jgi:hypothetical protein